MTQNLCVIGHLRLYYIYLISEIRAGFYLFIFFNHMSVISECIFFIT